MDYDKLASQYQGNTSDGQNYDALAQQHGAVAPSISEVRENLKNKTEISTKKDVQAYIASQQPEAVTRRITEPAATLVSGMVAQPISGIAGGVAGLARAIMPQDVGQYFPPAYQMAYDVQQDVQGNLTYLPKTKEGEAGLQLLGQRLAPIGNFLTKIENSMAEKGYTVAGPTGAAIGAMLPTAALTALGVPEVRSGVGATQVVQATKNLVSTSAKRLLQEAAPTIEGLKNAARGIYNELGNSGVVVSANSINRLRAKLSATVADYGYSRALHPGSSAVMREINQLADTDQPLKQIDIIRRVANNTRRGSNESDAELARQLIDVIDDHLDTIKPSDLINGNLPDVGAKYKDARQLWQRAKKAELIDETVKRSELQKSGFENGLRSNFTALALNKKKMQGFTENEKNAIKQVVRGGPAANITKGLGQLGYSEGHAIRIVRPTLAAAVGGSVGGVTGAVAVPVIGQVSLKLAQKLTLGNAKFAEAVVRAGTNGQEIVRAYLMNVPSKQRNVDELTELLLRQHVDLKKIKPVELSENKNLVKDALYFASFFQAAKNPEEEKKPFKPFQLIKETLSQ